LAAKIVSKRQSISDKFLIDYEHQTLEARTKGIKAPASGWGGEIEWRDDGLYLTGIEWTAAAASAIEAKEYRYISPVIHYKKNSGEITDVTMAALVNFAGLDGLVDLTAAASFYIEGDEMNEKNKLMLVALMGLTATATDEEISTGLSALQSMCGDGKSLVETIKESAEKVAALSVEIAGVPEKFVKVEALSELQTKYDALQATVKKEKSAAIIEAALADGRLKPGQKEAAEKLAEVDVEALSAFIKGLEPNAALGDQQGGPEGDGNTPQTGADIAAKATVYQKQQAALGVEISDVEAIDYVTKGV
jgi:phage I-like protein